MRKSIVLLIGVYCLGIFTVFGQSLEVPTVPINDNSEMDADTLLKKVELRSILFENDSLKKVNNRLKSALQKLPINYSTIENPFLFYLKKTKEFIKKYYPFIILLVGALSASLFAFYRLLLQMGLVHTHPTPTNDNPSALEDTNEPSEKSTPEDVIEKRKTIDEFTGEEEISSTILAVDRTPNTPSAMKDKRHFFSEVMVTAGPRKKFNTSPVEGDVGLGEDVAGVICFKDSVYFWVLDGTSDADHVDIPHPKETKRIVNFFSSRFLAQTIGWQIQNAIQKTVNSNVSARTILELAIKESRKEWEENLTYLSTGTRLQLRNVLKERKSLQCSTTAIFGILTLDGVLDVCQIGDSKLVVYPPLNQSLVSKGRQFFSLSLNEFDNIQFSHNDMANAHFQDVQATKVQTVMAMTDGISYAMEKWLGNMSNIDLSDTTFRRSLANQPGTTQDDKAICIVQIREI